MIKIKPKTDNATHAFARLLEMSGAVPGDDYFAIGYRTFVIKASLWRDFIGISSWIRFHTFSAL